MSGTRGTKQGGRWWSGPTTSTLSPSNRAPGHNYLVTGHDYLYLDPLSETPSRRNFFTINSTLTCHSFKSTHHSFVSYTFPGLHRSSNLVTLLLFFRSLRPVSYRPPRPRLSRSLHSSRRCIPEHLEVFRKLTVGRTKEDRTEVDR